MPPHRFETMSSPWQSNLVAVACCLPFRIRTKGSPAHRTRRPLFGFDPTVNNFVELLLRSTMLFHKLGVRLVRRRFQLAL